MRRPAPVDGWIILLLAGIPIVLLRLADRWLPSSPPNRTRIAELVAEPLTEATITATAALIGWLTWLVLVILTVRHGYRWLTRWRRLPRLRIPGPAQMVTATLVGTAAVSATSAGAAVADTGGPAVTLDDTQTNQAPATSAGTGTVERTPATVPPPTHSSAGGSMVYEVAAGDWLGAIADRYLGNFARYRDISALNPHLVPDASGPDGPDYIYPGERYRLPADAYDRGPHRHATGHLTAVPGPPTLDPPPATPTPATPTPATPPPTAPTPPESPHAAAPTGTASTMTTPAAPSTAAPSSPAASSDRPSEPGEQPDRGAPQDGVTLPDGWIALPLAAALITAAALAHRRRHRRRTTPGHTPVDEHGDNAPSPALAHIRRAVRDQAPELLTPHTPAPPTVSEHRRDPQTWQPESATTGPQLSGIPAPIPAGGLGLTGAGADAAARAVLAATLATGSPHDPDGKSEIVIPAATLTSLGVDVRDLQLPRLHLTTDIRDALTGLLETVVTRQRILHEHDADDLATLHATDPYHAPMPPVLLLTHTPPDHLHTELTNTLRLGAAVHVTALLIGAWPDQLTVDTGGHVNDRDQTLATLDAATATQLLNDLSDTGTADGPTDTAGPATAPDASAPRGAHVSVERPLVEHRPEAADTEATPPAEKTAQPSKPAPARQVEAPKPAPANQRARADIRLFGGVAIRHPNGEAVAGLRQHARQLLVYLAVHRDGANLPDIMETIWPDATLRRAAERLSTEVADLRRRIRQAANDTNSQPVINTGGRYHLNPDLVEVDLWRLTDTVQAANVSTDQARIDELREAVDLHAGDLAAGFDYDWIDTPRHQVRRHGINARMQLAHLLADTDPRRAAELTEAAADLEPDDENLAQHAIRALARAGHTTAIPARLHTLRAALADIDEEPSDETTTLAAHLTASAPNGKRPEQP